MATYADLELVKYRCTCDKKFSVCRLYLCKHCLKLRCKDCAQCEVDTPYCPHCLENMPSAEAKLKKNRCSSCFDCPVCGHTLVTRSTSHTIPNPDDPTKTIAKKMYYMACGFCRWTTRDVGLPDQNVATGSWPTLQNPHEQRDKFGGSVAGLRRKGMSTFSSMSSTESKVPGDLEPSATVDSFEPLSNEYFTEPAALVKTTKLAHRHSVPEFQPTEISKLHPIHKHLLMRKSMRCRECEHNLSKADFNPSSIKFKIQLTAQHHVPEIRIMNPSTFTMNK
ncbi:dynactin subunit 4, partial [Elysia marginata]